MDIEQIVSVCAQEYNCTADDLKSPSRLRNAADARHTAIHIIRGRVADLTFTRIGARFNRTRSTTESAFKKVEGLLSVDHDFASRYKQIVSIL